jgi:hypothetical protein
MNNEILWAGHARMTVVQGSYLLFRVWVGSKTGLFGYMQEKHAATNSCLIKLGKLWYIKT